MIGTKLLEDCINFKSNLLKSANFKCDFKSVSLPCRLSDSFSDVYYILEFHRIHSIFHDFYAMWQEGFIFIDRFLAILLEA